MKNEKKKNKRNLNQKGITLIALVITIIVLLILAGVTISMLAGDNRNIKAGCKCKRGNGISARERGDNFIIIIRKRKSVRDSFN